MSASPIPPLETLTPAVRHPHYTAPTRPTTYLRGPRAPSPPPQYARLFTSLKTLLLVDIALLGLIIFVALIRRFCFSDESEEVGTGSALGKRVPPGEVRDESVLLGVLVGGVGIALGVGIVTSWVLERKRLGPRRGERVQGWWGGVWDAGKGMWEGRVGV